LTTDKADIKFAANDLGALVEKYKEFKKEPKTG